MRSKGQKTSAPATSIKTMVVPLSAISLRDART
jgi:hypothetical protein